MQSSGVILLMNEFRPLVLKADDEVIAEDLRIRIRGRSNMTLLPDLFQIDIYNMSDDDQATVSTAKVISATDENDSILCYGEIEDVYKHPEESNVITTLVIADGSAFAAMTVSKTIGSGSKVRDALYNLLGNGLCGSILAPDVRIPRGQTFSGKLSDAVSMLAKTVNSRAFYTHGAVFVVEKGRADDVLDLAEDDVIDEPSFAEGICIVKAKVKGYSVGTILNFRGNRYRLASQSIDADNQKGPWRTELTLVDEESLSAYGMEGG